MSEAECNSWSLPWDGGCRCGATRFTIAAPPLLSMACHCTGCQAMTASAYSLSLAIPADGFAVTKGEPVLGGLKQQPRHFFCPECLTWMFTRPALQPPVVNVRATLLDDHAWFEPYAEFWIDEALPWAKTPAKRSYTGFAKIDDLGALLAAFQAEGARPG